MTTNKGTLASRLAGLTFFVALSLAATTAQAIFVRTAVNYRPVARAVVGTAAVIGTAAVVGSVVRSLPPSCSTMVVNNVPYQHCGNAYYQPQYSGSQVTYVVVNPPQH
jgi:hypothetical protein